MYELIMVTQVIRHPFLKPGIGMWSELVSLAGEEWATNPPPKWLDRIPPGKLTACT